MEILVELLLEFVLEAVVELIGEGAGWMLERRWGRVLLGAPIVVGLGLIWGLFVGDHVAPVVATGIVLAQTAAIPLLMGRRVFRRTLRRDMLVDLAVLGLLFVAGRWGGWALR